MNKSNARKRPAPPSQQPPTKQALAPEDEFVDEDVFLDETLISEDEESAILRDMEQRQALAARLSKWTRPPLSQDYVSQSCSILFQQLEIDYVIGESHKELLPNSSGPAAIIRIFGVTKEGHSVCCKVHGFEPYFYISCPPGMGPDDISHFHQILEARMREANRNSNVGKFVRRVEMVQRRSIMYYQQIKSHPFLKIVVALPTMVASCRGILDRGIQLDGLGMKSFMTYESNVLFALRFMIDCSIVGGNWIEIPAGKYKKATKSLSYCQLEFDCLYSDLTSHAPEGEYSKMAPFRILSFDIECAGRKGHFPEPTQDPVIQIANLVTLQGEDQPLIRNVMTLNSCSPIVGVDVMSFDKEEEVLLAWRDFIREVDPDIIIGYNICKFDLPYLIERAAALKIAEFPILGRIRNSRVRVKDTTFSSRQYGTRESKEISIEGRVQFDLFQVMQRDYKLSSYSLNSVSAHFLSEQKEDVHHSIISDLQNGNAETRRRLAVYCLKDAYLPQRLLDKLMFVYNYVEMARVTGVPISFLLSRGQSIKVLSQLLRKAKQKNLVIPNAKQAGSEQGTFEGATVLEARAGFYEKPIATLDFASLYPSIMMAYNLCYCTLVTPENARNFNIPPESVYKTPSGETFVKSNLQKGILPEILEELLAARKRAKADLKEAKDPLEKAVLDGRQLALKISANSVYGFTGATIGQLPCLEISSSVTSYGRQMIEHTKKLVEDKFTTTNGYEHNAEVIYGDTDSVMVQFGVSAVEEAMNLGREAAEYISGTFIKPIKLEFEKIYYPYLLISKKRYAGLFWTKPDKFDKMDTKGIETVRRDNCLLVKNLVTDCLHKILIDRDIPGAVQYVKNAISDLLMNRMDLSLLVITKGLTKTGDDYEVKTAHVELAERMRKRDAATAPNVGDRVPYVIIEAAKGAKAYEKSEDPIYVLENNIPIDRQYYLDNQISKPILRIFEPILKNASKELLHGSHTRSIFKSTPSNSGIMKFAKKQSTCIGCKALLSNGDHTLCSHCKGREAELYCKTVAQVSDLEKLFGRLWTQCQECQGSLHQDVLCTSRDCPIFYRRKKAQKDMAEARLQLDRWNF
ncbi:DNA polymerase delta catalytic subunit-like [Vicia villosa]|uniref:DNA polymerase delta catalytic subunit-like n=1 Tax=Vicia villosa TaxID=3911 RepID=UPI00273C85EC|nr:DNA polymerase delta catalytic subunit-like [Vicia villosa]XP_058756522.1 DNA polymerase delta catalytic subunit-like [Vicia villosa]XP_058756523.1 DNA polymerase delta catalytic subunit-like [Vicia villosa]